MCVHCLSDLSIQNNLFNRHRTESGKTPIFATTSYLASEEKELEFLRKLCEIMVIFLMPRGYSLLPMKNLLSEVLSYKSN